MPGLRGLHNHRPWTATPSGPRRPAGTHVGAARDLSSMGKDVYDLARSASAFRAFQLALPTAGLRIHRRGRVHRASGTVLQRSVAVARSIHAAPMGPTSTAQPVLVGKGWSRRLAPSMGIRSSSTIKLMRIGYAPGGCLRGWLTQLGHSLPALCQAGPITGKGYDAYVRRIVFPLGGNLYGRSLSAAAPPHLCPITGFSRRRGTSRAFGSVPRSKRSR
jgi:hypothetical protein